MTNPINGKGLTAATLTALVALVSVGVAAVVTLVVLGRPVDTVLSLITVIMVPTIIGILNSGKVDRLTDEVQQVKTQVNGRMSQLIDSKTTIKEGERSAD